MSLVNIEVIRGQEIIAIGFDELLEFIKKSMTNSVQVSRDETCGGVGDLYICTDFKNYIDIAIATEKVMYISITKGDT